MTIEKAINMLDTVKPNAYSTEEKIAWLSEIDGRIKTEIIDTHEGGESIVYEAYSSDTSLDTELVVKPPYDDIYVLWLMLKIEFYDNETQRYNNTKTMFNARYADFQNFYNRTQMPKSREMRYF